MIKSSFVYLLLLLKTNTFLSASDFKKAISAVVSQEWTTVIRSIFGIGKAFARLQNIQNAAARLIKSAKKMDHVTPLLRSLNWLPVQFRVHYKIIVLVFKALHNLAPTYLSELLSVYIPPRSLRSENLNLLVTVRTNSKRKGDRAFSRVGPILWNELPYMIRSVKSLAVFKSLLKTHLLEVAWGPVGSDLAIV